MIAVMQKHVMAICLIIASLVAVEARAQVINVGGTNYTFTLHAFGESFDDNSAAIMASPWWGSQAQAIVFRDAYLGSQGVPALFPGETFGFMRVGYDLPGPAFTLVSNAFVVLSNGNLFDFAGIDRTLGNNNLRWLSAVGPPVAVPEINGAALAQVVFILLAFGLWIRARRIHMKLDVTS